MRNKTTSAGFTLVEVLVVVVIASIVLVVLASVLGSSFEVLRTGETRAQLNSQARRALDYLADDLRNASAIPLSADRDLNGYPDEDPIYGYDHEAYWRVAGWNSENQPTMNTSFWISEAWSDRLRTSHSSQTILAGQVVQDSSFAVPRALRSVAGNTASLVEYDSLLRLAIPASNDMPYYLAGEWDRNGDGLNAADLRNTGTASPVAALDGFGEIQGYPELVPVGPYKETAALIQDLFGYTHEPGDPVIRKRQIPIASNITRIHFEYLHEVPVYMSRSTGTRVEIAYQDMTDGSINFVDADYERSGDMDDSVPLISHYELRPIDVAYNAPFTDPYTGLEYGGIHWQLADQYPEGMNPGKRDGTHVTPNTLNGLGDQIPGGWSMSVFYTEDEDGENAPIDRFAYVTASNSNGQPVEGGIAMLRPDMEAILGSAYYDYSVNPTDRGDLGDADGIPDGDGIPDDPVPGWWLPYLRAVRVTVIATPRQVIEERRSASGREGKSGTTVYYRLDSPVPYSDPNRLVPEYNLQQDFIGSGQDIVITETVPVDYVYAREMVTDPTSAQSSFLRRVEWNYIFGAQAMYRDPMSPDEQIRALSPIEKLLEKDPQT
ncbi:prepilin-type N-terminal cleavage/methylation domain-containing protein [bacterium]|nr:prepilin-type N-terminal cleavage/methylation domain-containing protein [bacterium]